ncbi:hypothetical protein POM88_031361 [Heracleum sosnowskyi]|uniref:F-box associated beta-propeller type 3 domain-containing protein n=1 Tax=Heracleum sosnowskyi TaxID=360622 RepID=A0AAD8MKA1_9APIA|nr:hypothetical protein POM88_031361 [Heracleum sosnowskyi]
MNNEFNFTDRDNYINTFTSSPKIIVPIQLYKVLYFDGGDVLVSFDLHDEVFRLVQFPSLIRRRKRSDVLDFEGSLAMVFESGPGVVDLWTLDHVSKEVSWTKKFSFGNDLDDLETKIWLSCYLGAGQFYGTKLLNGNCFLYEVLYYYEKKKETQCYGLLEYFANHILRHATYKYMETLVSLDGFEQVENVRKEML